MIKHVAKHSPCNSLVVNTRNEEKDLILFESVNGIDEIIVADMESTDKTLQIANKMGRVFYNYLILDIVSLAAGYW